MIFKSYETFHTLPPTTTTHIPETSKFNLLFHRPAHSPRIVKHGVDAQLADRVAAHAGHRVQLVRVQQPEAGRHAGTAPRSAHALRMVVPVHVVRHHALCHTLTHSYVVFLWLILVIVTRDFAPSSTSHFRVRHLRRTAWRSSHLALFSLVVGKVVHFSL